MSLNTWQDRLSNHFARLRDARVGRGAHTTVYALEHGLNPDEVAELKREIHAFLQNSSPDQRHYVAWAVYSAEIGYQYSGEEYWDTFCRLTPHWNNSYRDEIRDAYREFHRNFKATHPRGPWAEHFKIICWPITHAILPQDLQRELAQVLYDLRGSFTSQLLHDPDSFGKHIRDAAWNSGARFRKFAEDHLLVGQISTALLLSDEERHNALILPTTLERVTKDLDQNRKSREWLSYARQRAHQVNIRGLSRGDSENEVESALDNASLTATQREVVQLGLEPDLLLIKTAPNTWAVRLKLPDLSRLVRRFEALRSAVANQRCTIAGTEPRTFPKGYLLYGNQEVTLIRWPASDEILIKFDEPHKDLDYLLTAECLLRPGPTWLFKITGDGTARHVKSGVVKPGSSYLLLTRHGTGHSFPPALNSTTTVVSCEGVSAVQLDVPEVVSRIYSEELDSLHLHLAGGLEVAPVGLPAAKWDDAGIAEWLSTDQPLIRISADFDIDGILLNLVGPSATKLELQKPAWPLLVDIGKLDAGVYELHVLVSRPGSESLVSGQLQFTIREPRVWNGDKTGGTPFSAHVSPAAPTLEELWEGHVTVDLVGPHNYQAEGEIRFFANQSETPIYGREFGPLDLPCMAVAWSEAWENITSDIQAQNAYDASSECELVVSCEVGRHVLRALRESKPLRWIVKQGNSGYFLRFEQLDDQASVVFSRYPFRTPTEGSVVSEDPFSEFRVSDDGGLFVASTKQETASVVIPPAIRSLKWLAADVIVPLGSRSESSLSQITRTLEVWAHARSIGNLFAKERKHAVECALKEELIRLLCGDEWLSGERRYEQNILSIEGLRTFVSPAPRYERMGRDLIAKRQQLQTQTATDTVQLLETLSRNYLDLPSFSNARDHGVSRNHWAIDFSYRLLSRPENVRDWAQQEFVAGINYVLKTPILCRLARFAFLLSDAVQRNRPYVKAASR
jgi:hypothetical protein